MCRFHNQISSVCSHCLWSLLCKQRFYLLAALAINSYIFPGMIVGVIIKYGSSQPNTKPPHVDIINRGNNTYPDNQAPESVLLELKNKTMTIQYNIWGEVTEENKALSQLVMAVSHP